MRDVILGLDLGGTTFSVGWLDGADLHGWTSRPTGGHRPRTLVLDDLTAAVSDAVNTARQHGAAIVGLGVGVPAVIDPQEGRIRLLPNFAGGWNGFPLAAELERRCGLPTYLINDARAFLHGESVLGAARGADDVLGITVGTGVGGGLRLAGRLRFGPGFTAGEFGHQVIDPQGPSCGCGGRGCIEALACGPAIAAAALRPLKQGRTPHLRQLLGDDLNRLSPQLVAQAAAAGDQECAEVFARAGHAIGLGIVNAVSLLDLPVVVIGGGVAQAGPFLLDAVRETLARHLWVSAQPEVRPAALGEAAGVIGAAVWAAECGSARNAAKNLTNPHGGGY
ncbi:ROK family protein [Deinococcus sp.]|uniref:ROK family protein n=1 Tax=Deinococcus sp. TaxID=47478 RepID=UPI003CC56B0F